MKQKTKTLIDELSSDLVVADYDLKGVVKENEVLRRALTNLYDTINGNNNPPKYAKIALQEAKKALQGDIISKL